MPKLTFEEALEITKIHSITGKIEENNIIYERPFRNLHHTISISGMIGGGKIPKPGEITLAHCGVLFLDEFPEFNKKVIEALRSPIENRQITINRTIGSFTYPAKFMLIASMNPCPCGYYGDNKRACTCSEKQILNYRSKISGPILDRIDIQIEVPKIKYDTLQDNKGEASEDIKRRINLARDMQLKRYVGLNIYSNAELTPALIERFCKIDDASQEILKKSFEKLKLSARAYTRILKLARTIADLDRKENINKGHVLEAIQYRSLDRSC